MSYLQSPGQGFVGGRGAPLRYTCSVNLCRFKPPKPISFRDVPASELEVGPGCHWKKVVEILAVYSETVGTVHADGNAYSDVPTRSDPGVIMVIRDIEDAKAPSAARENAHLHAKIDEGEYGPPLQDTIASTSRNEYSSLLKRDQRTWTNPTPIPAASEVPTTYAKAFPTTSEIVWSVRRFPKMR